VFRKKRSRTRTRFETSRFSKICQVKPLDFEITEDRNKIRNHFDIDNAIPVEVSEEEDTLLNEAQRQKQVQIQPQEKRNKRIALSIAAVFY
jgi:hypothetical protein